MIDRTVGRCELHERQAWEACVEGCASVEGNPLRAEVARAGATPVPIVAALDFGLFNRVIGLGLTSQAGDESVDAIRSLYEARGQSNWTISVSPLAQPADLGARLERRGMRHASDVAKVVRSTRDAPVAETDLRVEAVGVDFAGHFAAVAVDAFGVPQPYSNWFRGTFGRPGWRHYIAFDDQLAVATGALYVDGDLGWLSLGATLPSHRRRGGQSAILARRIQDAARLGCRLVHSETGAETAAEPNPSYRNMLRSGFRLAYLRADYIPDAR